METMPAQEGWQVGFFYDFGELDLIDHFIAPDGERLEVWPRGYLSEQLPPVMCWRGMDDTDRLIKAIESQYLPPDDVA